MTLRKSAQQTLPDETPKLADQLCGGVQETAFMWDDDTELIVRSSSSEASLVLNIVLLEATRST